MGKASLELTDDLSVGDGVRFLSEDDYGMVVSRILLQGESVKIAKKGDLVVLDLAKPVAVGTTMMKTLDITLEGELKMYQDEAFKCLPVRGVFTAHVDEPLNLSLQAGGVSISHSHEYRATLAIKQATTEDQALDQLSKLGGTPYYWIALEAKMDASLFLPVKVLNELRRDAFAAWEQAMLSRKTPRIVLEKTAVVTFPKVKTGLVVHVETKDQYDAAVRHGAHVIYADESLSVPIPSQTELVVHKRRIRMDDIANGNCVIEDFGMIHHAPSKSWIAGQYLNATNIHTAALFASHGATVVTLSPELSKERVEQFSAKFQNHYGSTPNLELVVYGRVDLMITKYCPIAKTMGANKTHCHLCEHAQYSLEDRSGITLPLKNDGNCNIRVLNARPTMLFDYLHDLTKAGVLRHRIDFTIESGEEASSVLSFYKQALARALPALERKLYTTGRFLR